MKENLKLLGMKVRDAITGFEGIVTSISFDISGCIQGYVCARSKNDEKEISVGSWFDTKRLRLLGKSPVITQPEFISVPGGQNLPAIPSGPVK